jgi:hypothetical protein
MPAAKRFTATELLRLKCSGPTPSRTEIHSAVLATAFSLCRVLNCHEGLLRYV